MFFSEISLEFTDLSAKQFIKIKIIPKPKIYGAKFNRKPTTCVLSRETNFDKTTPL